MAEYPCFPLWTDAYLGDTSHLSTIEHGAYLLLLIAMWRAPLKSLPNDDRQLAKFARLTGGQWARIRSTLMPYFDIAGDRITQGRLTDEANAVRQHRGMQSDKAKARWLKEKKTSDATAMPEACRPDAPFPTPSRPSRSIQSDGPTELKLETPGLISTPAPRFDFARFYKAYPLHKARGRAELAWQKAIKLHPPDLIIAAAERYALEVRGKDPDFIKHPATWLNAKCWEDEPAPSRKDQGAIDAIKAFVTGDIKDGFPAHDAIDRLVETVALPAPAGVVRKAGED